MLEKLAATSDIKNRLIIKIWPLSVVFLAIYTPYSFFISNDILSGWLQLGAFLALVLTLLFYFKTKNILIVGNVLAAIGIPVLIPWLVSGGPSGAGLWWTLLRVLDGSPSGNEILTSINFSRKRY
jgi:hypothetical protein